jgi:hypothetical protein
MEEKALFVWVEGPDDLRFFKWVVQPVLETKYRSVQVVQYSEETPAMVKNFLRTIAQMGNAYIFVSDADDAPCITSKKARLKEKFGDALDEAKILVVKREIESWYFAGLNAKKVRALGIRHNYPYTDAISKEDFNNAMPGRFTSRTDFMIEILKVFSLEEAKGRNDSLRYFVEKYLAE